MSVPSMTMSNLTFQLSFSRFNLEQSPDCNKDSVIVRNGGSFTSPVVWKKCGSALPSLVRSMSSQMIVQFHTDVSTDSNSGFTFTASAHSAGCGGVLHGATGNVTSPNEDVPGSTRYPNSAECIWEIRGEPGFHVTLRFYDRRGFLDH